MGELGSQVGTDELPCQGLQENAEVQLPLQEIAKASCHGDRQDDHHAGADGLYQRHAENNQQGKLYKGGSTDAEGAGDEAVDGSCQHAVYVQLFAFQQVVRKVKQGVQPV